MGAQHSDRVEVLGRDGRLTVEGRSPHGDRDRFDERARRRRGGMQSDASTTIESAQRSLDVAAANGGGEFGDR